MDNNISVFTAFFAGVLSFLSPCVLPLASSYLFFISGVNAADLGGDRDNRGLWSPQSLHIVTSTLFFIVGFSAVFILLSVLIYGFIFFLGGLTRILHIIAGSIVSILGFNIIFNFIPFLKYDDHSERCMTCTPKHSILAAKEGSFFHPSSRPKGHGGAFLVGVAFGAGWTPCVGAFLGSILLLAGQSETIGRAAIYLGVYSAGLGLPFLVISFFWVAVIRHLYKFQRVMPLIKIISGIFLILMGLLMALGRLGMLNAFFQQKGYALSQWAQSGDMSVRLIPGILFFLAALLPLAVHLIKKGRLPGIIFCIWSILLLGLGVIQALGLINCTAFISQWFTFSGL